MNKKIRVLVVDDSAFMRKSISIMLESDPEIEVVATAKDGMEGIEAVKKYQPDIVTLDIEMPRMDGLQALERIMEENPVPVLMVSSLTTEGAEATIKALELGAVDFIPKELSFVSVNIINIKEDLLRKVKEIVKQREKIIRRKRLQIYSTPHTLTKKKEERSAEIVSKKIIGHFRAVAIGISTGGPMSLQKVIPRINKKINVPVFVVQHMPPKFTKSLADRLNSLSEIEVKEAENNEIVRNGVVYFAPGGFHMLFKKQNGDIKILISENPSDTLHKPSVDVMLESLIEIYGKDILSVIMTGMGKDGYQAIKHLVSMGGKCIAQDEESCVVYGMPKAVVDANLADAVVPLEKIADKINEAFL